LSSRSASGFDIVAPECTAAGLGAPGEFCYTAVAMGTPQDPRAHRRKRQRRAKKNLEWELTRARENAEADKPKAPPKKAT
jgi:hypothetical protein